MRAPDGQVGRVGQAVGDALDEGPRLGDQAVGVGREAEELGQLADQDGQRDAVQVAVADGRREEVGDEAEAGATPAPRLMRPAITARPPASATAVVVSPPASGRMVAAMRAASDESGPRTRMRLGPKMA